MDAQVGRTSTVEMSENICLGRVVCYMTYPVCLVRRVSRLRLVRTEAIREYMYMPVVWLSLI